MGYERGEAGGDELRAFDDRFTAASTVSRRSAAVIPMSGVRWLIVVISPVLALAGTFVSAAWAITVLGRLCPADRMVSGMCTALWYPAAEVAAYALSALMGGYGFVVLPAWLAPRSETRVSWAAFGAGLAFAAAFAWQGGSSLAVPFIAALLGGASALSRVSRTASKEERRG